MITARRILQVIAVLIVSCTASAQTITGVAVAPQYDSSHVYVAPAEVNSFVRCFLGTFGGSSTKQIVATVTPTPSSTTSQILQTPVGTISLFGFTTPIPYPFGEERTGLLVTDMDDAVKQAQASGAEVVVAAFPDPIGRDAIVRFPGGVLTQLYWHTTTPHYAPFTSVPENRVYVSPDGIAAFLKSFLSFSRGRIVSDNPVAEGREIGRSSYSFRRIAVESNFGKLSVFVTDGILPYPYGRETTGYQVSDLSGTLAKATSLGATIVVPPVTANGRTSSIVRFPGGYIAEIHSLPAER